jgi:hypothetical protein
MMESKSASRVMGERPADWPEAPPRARLLDAVLPTQAMQSEKQGDGDDDRCHGDASDEVFYERDNARRDRNDEDRRAGM